MSDPARALRLAVFWVAALNLAYFFVEFGVARAIASVALFADSIDFLEDASVNFLVLVALGWTVRKRAMVGLVLAALLLVKVRNVAGSLSRAAFLSARNDAYAGGAIVLAAGVTVFWPSAWPDLVVGIGIFLLNLGAAHEVFEAARREAGHRP